MRLRFGQNRVGGKGEKKESNQREGNDGDLRGKWVVNGWLGGICRVTHQSARMKNGQSAIRQIESKKNMAEMLLFQTANWLPGWLTGHDDAAPAFFRRHWGAMEMAMAMAMVMMMAMVTMMPSLQLMMAPCQ